VLITVLIAGCFKLLIGATGNLGEVVSDECLADEWWLKLIFYSCLIILICENPMVFRRKIDYLSTWKDRRNRKPLIIRGARQVGKTYLVRDFAKTHFKHLIEINFDQTPEKAELFQSTDVETQLSYLSADAEVSIEPGETLIFLDEIQRVPDLLGKLRYLYEKRPDLHVIAAGSLLDFALTEKEFSMPVGRIEYLFLGPMDFREFLLANGQKPLVKLMEEYKLSEPLPISFHDKLLKWFRMYLVVGGMPGAVSEFVIDRDWQKVRQELVSIALTYRDDFSKYRKRIHAGRLGLTLDRIPNLVGRKLKYVDVSREERSKDIAQALHMLEMAQVIYQVHHSAGNGLPLRAERKLKDFKPLFLDVGLMLGALGLKLPDLVQEQPMSLHQGSIAEQFIGQHLLYMGEPYEMPELFYWNREKRNSAAEVDYLYPMSGKVLPIEVKAGTGGSLKSLHVFAEEKQTPLAVRFNLDRPSVVEMETNVSLGKSTRFQLLSLPLYMVSEMPRLCGMLTAER